MKEWIILLALAVAALSLVVADVVCFYCRRMERRKNLGIFSAVHEQDRLAKELERARIEKQTIERVLRSKLPESGEPHAAPPKIPPTSVPHQDAFVELRPDSKI